MRKLDEGTLLSTLWLFILLNIIFRDLHQFARADVLEMLLDGHYFGIVLTEELALLGGFLSLVPISMVLFSRVLLRRYARPMTFLAALIQSGTMFSSVPSDLDDGLHLVVQALAMVAIVMIAWRWADDAEPAGASSAMPT